MNIIEIQDLHTPGVELYSSLTEAQLRKRINQAEGIFIAESPKVIGVALRMGYEPVSYLCERRHIEGDAASLLAMSPDVSVYTGSRELLAKLTGYTLTRGVLCAMRRPSLPTVEEICSGAKRIAVIDGVVDSTNVGAIFRSAAALGIDAVVLTSNSCDPLTRRSVRVSMGSVFLVPWTWLPEGSDASLLRQYGFKTVAMALTERSVPVDDEKLVAEPRLAIILGTEGDGLPQAVIDGSDYTARIPMSHQVDSLNVAAASAVAFWVLRAR